MFRPLPLISPSCVTPILWRCAALRASTAEEFLFHGIQDEKKTRKDKLRYLYLFSYQDDKIRYYLTLGNSKDATPKDAKLNACRVNGGPDKIIRSAQGRQLATRGTI